MLLAIYAICGAMFLPRIFSGQTTVFIPVKGVITEVTLSPVSGNITQNLYFLLGCLCFFGTSIVLLDRQNFIAIRNGFMAWAILQVAMGFADLAGKTTARATYWHRSAQPPTPSDFSRGGGFLADRGRIFRGIIIWREHTVFARLHVYLLADNPEQICCSFRWRF